MAKARNGATALRHILERYRRLAVRDDQNYIWLTIRRLFVLLAANGDAWDACGLSLRPSGLDDATR
jgi:hypothetical protein